MNPQRPRPADSEGQLDFTLELAAHQPALTAFLRALLPVGEDPRDVLQEVNITLWKKKSQFSPGTNFKAWAFKVARYHVLNHLRTLRRRHEVALDGETLDRLSDLAEERIGPDALESRREALRQCLAKLPESRRELIRVRYYRQALDRGLRHPAPTQPGHGACDPAQHPSGPASLRPTSTGTISRPMNPPNETEDLIAAYFDGSLDEADLKRLRGLLESSAVARELYLEHSLNHHLLADIHEGPALLRTGWSERPKAARQEFQRSLLAAAACFAVLLGGLLLYRTSRPELPATLSFRDQSIYYYATPEGGRELPKGGSLQPGRTLYLEEGALKARLDSGVVAVIQSPAVLRLEDARTLRMGEGRGYFIVPHEVQGFTVVTPDHRVVDLGTEFGVLVRPQDGHEETHVFKGRVAVEKPSGARLNELQAGDALALVGSEAPRAIASAREDFITELQTEVEVVFTDGFEYPLADNEVRGPLTPAGWSVVGPRPVGVFNPQPGVRYYNAPGLDDDSESGGAIGAMLGPRMAYLYDCPPESGLGREVSRIQPRSDYTLVAAIGHRPFPEPDGIESRFAGYTIRLMSGDTVLASTSSDEPPGGPDTVEFVHLLWNSSDLPAGIAPGDPLAIRITTLRGGAQRYLDIDHVRLVRCSK